MGEPVKKTKSPSAEDTVKPRVKVWLELRGEYVFGHGLSRMLEAVRETGSIKEAAKALGKSYRYVWGRIKRAEESIGESLVETQVGGTGAHRSDLTPRAVELLDAFHALRQRMTEVLEEDSLPASAGKSESRLSSIVRQRSAAGWHGGTSFDCLALGFLRAFQLF